MDEERRGKIEGLNETLNSRTRYHAPLDKRTPVKQLETQEVGSGWQSPALDEMLRHERIIEPLNPFMKKIFLIALIFFLGAIGLAGYIFTGGANFISSRNVDISILGPTNISAGETLELGVSISNTNNADLEIANLSIQYPQGARNPENTAESLTFTKDSLGDVRAGAEAVRNVRVVLLGTTGETKEIKFSVEYKVKGSNATFYKDKIYEVTIGNAPISLNIENPESVTSGGEFTTTLSVTLNATDILKNVVLKAEYPYGYTVSDSNPKSASDNNLWVLGDLSPGDKKTITIRGRLVGENEEERTFRYYIGVSDSNTNSSLKIPIASLLDTVQVDRASIGLSVSLNGENTSTYIAPAARAVNASISFQNNLPDKLLNPRLEVSLSGAALDKQSVRAGSGGVYDATNSKVTWDLRNNIGSAELAPGSNGQVSLSFSSISAAALSMSNKDIVLNFVITGVPVGAVGQGTVSSSENRVVKISSQVNLSSKVLRTLGPFANHGPIPPKVGEETTYATIITLGNTQSDIGDAKVTARLGAGVTWLGAPSSGEENITYDSLANTLTWNVGTLSSDSGFSAPSRELAFQVSLKPILGQVGTTPVLVDSIVFTGRDGQSTITVNNPPLTTRLMSDPAFVQGDDIVVK